MYITLAADEVRYIPIGQQGEGAGGALEHPAYTGQRSAGAALTYIDPT